MSGGLAEHGAPPKSLRMNKNNDKPAAVLYNAQCPVCRAEIEHYADYSRKEALQIRFDDLNSPEALALWNVDADTAARRLHVVKYDQLTTGIPAFITLWQEMPSYRWLARVVALPGIFQIACVVYNYILAPLIYHSHQRRMRRENASS